MKPTDRVLEVDSTLAGENIRMGIDTTALQHIISVLTDLYSDPELAVIREYSTNALDAHRDAGNPLPIEVTLPSPLAPFFRVRDYGDGLDVEGIRNIYSRYGTSTKRDSNDVVGMLGLGCKSALTYCDQFTLIGTKDGRTVQVSVSRDEDGGGSMTIVSDEATPDAASGVEVVIPAKRDNKFDAKARDFFRFWTPGSVLVNGAQPAFVADEPEFTWLEKGKLAIITGRTNGSYSRDVSRAGWVVMGNVAYPMPEEPNVYNRRYTTVAFVDIGEVNFTPSREALQMTRTTKATLEQITADVKAKLTAAMQRTVTDAATPHEAIRAAQQAERTGVKIADLTYKGKPIPVTMSRRRDLTTQSSLVSAQYLMVNLTNARYSRKSGEQYTEVPVYAEGRVYFTNFAAKEFSGPKRAKFEAWLETDEGKAALPNGKPTQLVCVESLTSDERFWTQGTTVLDWTPIQAIKVDRPANVGPGWKSRPSGSYELVNGGHIEAGDIDLTLPLCWIRITERYDSRGNRRNRNTDGMTLLVMPANRQEKFLRDFPHALHYGAYIKKEATDWLASQDAALVEAAKYRISGHGHALANLDPARVNDPELVKWIKLQNVQPGAVQTGIERRADLLDLNRYDLTGAYPNPLENYPLISGPVGKARAEHVYLYLNAAYAADRSATS